jgi:hypothetical protein
VGRAVGAGSPGGAGPFAEPAQADPARAVELLERAVALGPENPRYHRSLASATFAVDRARGLEVAREGVRRFPNDPLSHYDLALLYRNAGFFAEMEQALDANARACAPS